MDLPELPETFEATRGEIQRVAAHVLARRRGMLTGKIGLRATPGGVGTPAAGPDHHHEVVRIAGSLLVRECTGAAARTSTLDLVGASLSEAAAAVGADLAADFSVGHDTPPLGDVHAPLVIDPAACVVLGAWFALGSRVLDQVVGRLGPAAEPSVVQIWPEHFDAGCDVGVGEGRRANLGASPGDAAHAAPYLYLGPWDAARPGDPAYWNASFGAVLGYDDLRASPDPVAAGIAFLEQGIGHLTA